MFHFCCLRKQPRPALSDRLASPFWDGICRSLDACPEWMALSGNAFPPLWTLGASSSSIRHLAQGSILILGSSSNLAPVSSLAASSHSGAHLSLRNQKNPIFCACGNGREPFLHCILAARAFHLREIICSPLNPSIWPLCFQPLPPAAGRLSQINSCTDLW